MDLSLWYTISIQQGDHTAFIWLLKVRFAPIQAWFLYNTELVMLMDTEYDESKNNNIPRPVPVASSRGGTWGTKPQLNEINHTQSK